MRFTFPPVALSGLTCLCLVCGAAGCNHAPPPASTPRQVAAADLPLITAEMMTVLPQVWPQLVRAQGSLIADEVAVVGAKVSGRVAQVHVNLGDKIDAGKPLVTLEKTPFQLEIVQAEAELLQVRAAVGLKPGQPVSSLDPNNAPPVREQKATWNEVKERVVRLRPLSEQSAITRTDFEQAVAAEEVAAAKHASALNAVATQMANITVREAALEVARQRLADADVIAPFAGLVQERQVAPGSFVSVGQAVSTIVRANPLRFRGTLPERYAQRLSLGQEVRLRIQSATGSRVVTVTRISPALDPLSRALLFEAEVENADSKLRSGLFGEADVVIDQEARAIVVPDSAVVEFAGTEKAWRVVNGVAEEKVVSTGDRRDGRIEILSGLQEGDVILLRATEGKVARVQPPEVKPAAEHDPAANGNLDGENISQRPGTGPGPTK